MHDRYGRNIEYMRISLTDRCNLRCIYCMPEEGICQVAKSELLNLDEIVKISSIASEFGISRIKLTGGEPLVRKICVPLVRDLKNIPGIKEVTLTTNGILLKEQLPGLMAAGLDAVNISLDTLDKEMFLKLTRRDQLAQVLDGITAALSYTSLKVKLNCVPTFQSEQDLIRLAAFARDYPIHVRFIEMMPIGLGKNYPGRNEDVVKKVLENAYGPMTPTQESLGNGPCHYYILENFQGRIGFISAISHKFCDQCNRIRLTSTGYMKSCLQFENGADLKKILRQEKSDSILKETIGRVIYEKPAGHNFQCEKNGKEESHIMAQIGG